MKYGTCPFEADILPRKTEKRKCITIGWGQRDGSEGGDGVDRLDCRGIAEKVTTKP